MQSCSSLIASASAADRRLRPLQLLLPTTSASTAPLKLLLPDRVGFNCSPIASASTAAPRLCPLQRLLARLRPFRLLLSDCMHSLVAPAGFQPMTGPGRPMFSKILRGVRGSVNRCTSLVPPHEHPTSVMHRHTHAHTHVKLILMY